MVVIGGDVTFGAWCDTEEEAQARLNQLEIDLDYHNISTMEEESTGKKGVKAMAERVRIMNERYEKSGRSDPKHPFHSIYTGLAEEYEQVSSNNPK